MIKFKLLNALCRKTDLKHCNCYNCTYCRCNQTHLIAHIAVEKHIEKGKALIWVQGKVSGFNVTIRVNYVMWMIATRFEFCQQIWARFEFCVLPSWLSLLRILSTSFMDKFTKIFSLNGYFLVDVFLFKNSLLLVPALRARDY
jgi:hypothetical protein